MAIELTAPALPLKVDANGVVRVGGTRETLDTVVGAFLAGCTAEGIVEKYPAIGLSDVYATIAYYLANRLGVDAYLETARAQGLAVRRENERRWNPQGFRERLLRRQASR